MSNKREFKLGDIVSFEWSVADEEPDIYTGEIVACSNHWSKINNACENLYEVDVPEIGWFSKLHENELTLVEETDNNHLNDVLVAISKDHDKIIGSGWSNLEYGEEHKIVAGQELKDNVRLTEEDLQRLVKEGYLKAEISYSLTTKGHQRAADLRFGKGEE